LLIADITRHAWQTRRCAKDADAPHRLGGSAFGTPCFLQSHRNIYTLFRLELIDGGCLFAGDLRQVIVGRCYKKTLKFCPHHPTSHLS
jgi:hypothetical protein